MIQCNSWQWFNDPLIQKEMLVWAWESAPRCAGIPAGTDNCFCAGDTAKFCLCAFSDCGHISSPAAATVSWWQFLFTENNPHGQRVGGKCQMINVSWKEMSQHTSIKKSHGEILYIKYPATFIIGFANVENQYNPCHQKKKVLKHFFIFVDKNSVLTFVVCEMEIFFWVLWSCWNSQSNPTRPIQL